MASKADAFNETLRHLGQPATVIDPDVPGSRGPHGEAIAAAYETVLRAVLHKHPWNCATERKALAAMVDGPLFGDGAYFELPADCVRLWSVPKEGNGRQVKWKRERGGKIWADQTEGPLYAFCIMLVDNPVEFDPELFKVFTLELAAECCLAVTGSSERKGELIEQAARALPNAAAADSQEDSGDDDTDSGDLLDARAWVS